MQKEGKKETKWNELKGELEYILDASPHPTLVNEATYRLHFVVYCYTFPQF